jgi:ABC-2 type transport system permease protein
MIRKIARKEFTEMWRDGRFRWLVGIVSVVFLASLFAGWHNYAEAATERVQAQAAERERWLNKGEMSGHSAAHFGQWAFRPDSPLSAIDQGVTPYTGAAVFLEAHARNPLQYRPAADTTAARRYGELTAAAVLQIFVPLLIILLVYPVFVGEREQGTLRHLISVGVPAKALALGKLIGVVGPLLLVLIPITVLGVLSLMLFAGDGFTADSGMRLALMAIAYLMYFAVFAGAALVVSALASSSRQALILLLAFWFVSSLMMPQIAVSVATRIHPNIDGYQLPAMIANLGAEVPTADELVPEIEKRLLAEYNVERAADLPIDPRRVANLEREAIHDLNQKKVFDQLHDAYEQQDRIYQIASIVAPGVAVQALSTALSETHFSHYRLFADSAEAYRRDLVRTMDEADLHNENARPGSATPIRQTRETWEKVPPFECRSPGLTWSLGKSFISIIVLAVWFIGMLIVTPLTIFRLKAG